MKNMLFVFMLLPVMVVAQPISATLSADSSHILIGNPLTIRLSIMADQLVNVQVPVLKDSLGKWEILQTSPLIKGKENGKILFSQNIVVTAWDSGRYEIPALPIFYVYGQDSQQIQTNPIAVRVLTVAVDTTQAIKPLKAPLQANYMWQEAIPYLGIVVLVSLIGLGYFLHKKYKNRKAKTTFILPPKAQALKSLQKLSQMDLAEVQQLREYYAGISLILREYISQTKGFSAKEMVSDEIISALSEKVSTSSLQDLSTLLSRSDLVKFAKYSPNQAEHIAILVAAKAWIEGH